MNILAGVTYNQGMEDLRGYLMIGSGEIEDYKSFIKALSGDIVLVVSPATATQAATEAAWEKEVTIKLQTADGEDHRWFSGKLALAISDDSTAGTASILPTETAPYMVDGQYTLKIKGDAKAWLKDEEVTLTVNVGDQDPAAETTDYGVLGYAVTAKTCVVTIVE